jgi:BioD-like phosphotransacetylase family protein
MESTDVLGKLGKRPKVLLLMAAKIDTRAEIELLAEDSRALASKSKGWQLNGVIVNKRKLGGGAV